MSDVLLNGLVAVPAAFALLAGLVARRERAAVRVAVLGSLVAFGWSVWLVVEMYGGALGEPGSTVDVMWLEAL
ncbi:MAG TPA: hypothetical protein VGD51_08015, partial [Nocardioidaceae bacterium]